MTERTSDGLPLAHDGTAVTWDPWETAPSFTHIDMSCPGCGELRPPRMTKGRISITKEKDAMRDRKLSQAIDRENRQEALGEIRPQDRTTCYPHQSWATDCADRHTQDGPGRGMDECLAIARLPRN